MNYRITTLNVVGAAILAVLAVVLLVILLWAGKEIQKPYDMLMNHTEISKEAQITLRTQIDTYLNTGNAVKLTKAEEELKTIAEKIKQLPESVAGNVLPRLVKLQSFLATELRAAGKLSGNVQGLLYNAEKEISDNLSLVSDYAKAGSEQKASVAVLYVIDASRLYEILKNISTAREKYFATSNAKYKSTIEQQVQAAKRIIQSMESHPPLGIKNEADEDELLFESDDDTETEEKVTEYLSELSSLFSRYLKEVANTEKNMSLQRVSHKKTQDLLAGFEASIGDIVGEIDTYFESIQNKTFAISIITIALFLLLVAVVNFMQHRFVKTIMKFIPYLNTLAQGDLRESLYLNSTFSELKNMEQVVNELRERLSGLINDIRHEAEEVQSVSSNLTESYHIIHGNSYEQKDQTAQSATAVNEMNASFTEVAQNASRAAQSAADAESAVKDGDNIIQVAVSNISELMDNIQHTSETINVLQTESNNIEKVLMVIEGIAEQTNLLALNAAIEAARAGEQGRGFAVVADEVRQLSQRTTSSIQEIKINIDKLQDATGNAVSTIGNFIELADSTSEKVHSASQSFNIIVNEITTIRDMNTMIASATEEQLNVAGEIDKNMISINDMTQRSVESVENTMNDNKRMTMTSETLMASVGKFMVN